MIPSHPATAARPPARDAAPSPATRSGAAPAPSPASWAPPGADAPAPEGAARPPRSPALDRLRGVALVGMLVHHLTDWLTGDARAVLPGWRSFALTDAAAVAFFVAAGASMALFVASRRRRGMPRWRVGAQVARRYGLLVPIGLALDWVLWRNPLMFGVLEALGVTVVLAAAIAAVVSTRLLPVVTAAVVGAGVWSEGAVEGRGDWWSHEVISGKFPLLTYLGFVLVGVTVARTGWYADRRKVAAAALVATVATLGLLADGLVPARYPGDVHFVVPGLAVTVIVYALAQLRWSAALAGLDRVLSRAAAHTLGVFVAHYVLYGLLRRAGLLGEVAPGVAVPVALVTTVAVCLIAPRVPQLPWSLRTGRRTRGAAARLGSTVHATT